MTRKTDETGAARRGRPRAYDTQTALKQATDAFWRTGYSGTSLDAIAAATGMNPPRANKANVPTPTPAR